MVLDQRIQVLGPIGNTCDHGIDIPQLVLAGTVGIDFILVLEILVIFLLEADGDHSFGLFAGKLTSVDQMYSQFSGIRSSHSTILTCGRYRTR